ncbi:MAG TPA: hypothetical protein VLG37_00480 [Candidatus Saccharimonadales bacterium]|nr:hypothetical protein [Candidatus Saccharimonadales bacterium]
MDAVKALKYVSCVDLFQKEFAYERQLHLDNGNEFAALPADSGWRVEMKILGHRVYMIARAGARGAMLGAAAYGAAAVTEKIANHF